MERLLVRGAQVYQEGRFTAADVLCADGRILSVGQQLDGTGAQVLDGAGCRLSPGFIDVHTHGAVGVDVNAADEEGLERIAAFFASQGVTAWLASVLTDTEETTRRCLETIRRVMGRRTQGAQLLGAHLEGPFLSPQYKGAMPPHLLKEGDPALLDRYLRDFPGVVRYLTVAPEVPNGTQLIAAFAQEVAVAIGHSGADYETAMQAIRNGARCVTHTFNGMRLFHQHEPAIMGAALESDVWCEAICDGRHLHPATVRLLLKCKGWDRMVAITDSIMAAGLPDGRYRLGVNDVVVTDGDAMLANGQSRAGSTLTMSQALHNLMRFTGAEPQRLLPLMTANPAQALRLSRKGSISPGMDADLTLLDAEWNVCAAVVGGRVVFRR